MSTKGGFTLLEVLVYIGLFSIIMTGALVGAYQIIGSSVSTRQRVVLEQEAHFVFRKIVFALSGSVSITAPEKGNTGSVLTVDGTTFVVNTVTFELELGGNPLTASGIEVTQFTVERTPASEPDAVSVSFVLNDRQFATTTRYVR